MLYPRSKNAVFERKKSLDFHLSFFLVQGNRQISNFIMQDVDIILHHAKLMGVAI